MMRFVLVFVVCFGMALGGEIQRSEHWISGSSHSSLQTVCTGNTPTLCGSTCCQYSPCTTSNTCPSCPGSDTVCQGAGTTYNAPPVCCPTSTSRCYVKLGYNTCQKICSSSESQCADGELCFVLFFPTSLLPSVFRLISKSLYRPLSTLIHPNNPFITPTPITTTPTLRQSVVLLAPPALTTPWVCARRAS